MNCINPHPTRLGHVPDNELPAVIEQKTQTEHQYRIVEPDWHIRPYKCNVEEQRRYKEDVEYGQNDVYIHAHLPYSSNRFKNDGSASNASADSKAPSTHA